MNDWVSVANAVNNARAVAWDGCHKIYILMDDEQVERSEDLGYTNMVYADDTGSASSMYEAVRDWYEESCELRFVQSLVTNAGGANLFTTLIEQG